MSIGNGNERKYEIQSFLVLSLIDYISSSTKFISVGIVYIPPSGHPGLT